MPVGALLVQMKQAQFFDAALEGQIKGIGVYRVTPVNKGFIFLGRVFGIMDEQIRLLAEIRVIAELESIGMDISQLIVR